MNKIIKLLLSLLMFAGSINLNAQKQWTLQDCISYALQNNIQIKRQELQSDIAKNNYRQSKMEILPNLNVGAGHSWSYGRNVDKFTNEFTNTTVKSDDISVKSSMVLFNGFQTINSIQQNKYMLETSLQDYERAKNDISIQIATVFLQILSGEEALDIAQKQFDVTHLELEKTQKLVEVGNKAKGDLLEMRAQEANEKYNVINASNNLKISYLTLIQFLELKSTEDFKVKGPDSIAIDNTNVLSSVDDIYKEAEAKLPQIKSAEYQLKSYEKALAVARGGLSPQLSLSGSYYTGYSNARTRTDFLRARTYVTGFVNDDPNMPVLYHDTIPVGGKYPFFSQLKDNNNKSISLDLSVPLFNRFRARNNVSNAKIRVYDASYNLDQSKKSLYQEIQKAHSDATGAFEQYNSANEAAIANDEVFKYTQQKFDVGMVSSVDYNIAKNNLTKAKSNLIQAKYQYIFKIKVLDFYKGVPIVL